VHPEAFIAAHPDGVPAVNGLPTEWFTSAAPAELRELDSVLGLLVGAVGVSFAVLLAVAVYALLSQLRIHRHDLAVLHAVGFTRRQLAGVAAWQSLPLALLSALVGVPVGLALGRSQYTAFARRLGVVEAASTPPVIVTALALGVLVVLAISVAAAMRMARRTAASIALRSE
jgi:putative ABC transport system permease protein